MKYLLMSLLLIGLISSANAAVIGNERFDYPDGSNIDDQFGGTGWDAGGVKDWDVFWGTPTISDGAVTTNNAGIVRAFGLNEQAGAVQATGQAYFGVTMTATDTYDWAGMSSYDFGTERIFFGIPGGQTVIGSNLGYYGIDNSSNDDDGLTNIPVVKNVPARIVGCIDFEGQQLLLWVNPDADDYDNGGGDNSADLALSYTLTNWSSAVRLASGRAVEWDDLMVATTWEEIQYINIAHDPLPAYGQEDVLVSGLQLSWEVPLIKVQPEDPNLPAELIVDPNLASFNLYYTDTDPNLDAVSPVSITTWDTETLRASHTPSVQLLKNSTCTWRVDTVMDDATIIQGLEWFFYTELTRPVILTQPAAQIVDSGSAANFSVVISSESPPTFQWYKYVDGISDLALNDGGDISVSVIDNGDSTFTGTLAVANVEPADEGMYYCTTNNDAGIEVDTNSVPLAIKRKLAYWPFDGGALDSTVVGSPLSVVVGDPNVAAGILGDGIAFDDGVDMLYTDPYQVSYFDICDYGMTVAVWVKTTDNQNWCPLVAKNGEGQGWQLRKHGNTSDRPCFTTRGTGNEDGTAANRGIYDGNWHYVVGTFDGTIKKVYIDGIVSRVYSGDTGEIVKDGDAVVAPINYSKSPVAIAGRVSRDINHVDGLNIETGNIVAGTYDEIEIYNYALDAATIAQTYATLSGNNVCLTQTYDLDGDCVVNLDDLSLLASEWLNSQLVEPVVQ
jgi:hypothetical protein